MTLRPGCAPSRVLAWLCEQAEPRVRVECVRALGLPPSCNAFFRLVEAGYVEVTPHPRVTNIANLSVHAYWPKDAGRAVVAAMRAA